MEPIVETNAGNVRGSTQAGVHVFKGIPYGGPTTGRARFKTARPPAPWAGVREATNYGPTSPQVIGPAPTEYVRATAVPQPTLQQSEDCLVLNVWTRHLELDKAARRPLLVWFHGGGFFQGSGSRSTYAGANLAREQDVVVVTLNHRLGALGYLYLAELGGDEYADSGNVGNLDLVLALEWVRDNITRFGGDPENVTVFGHSGGAGKVTHALVLPAARGLFQRAIGQSGMVTVGLEPAEATRKAETFLRLLGLTRHELDKLHAIPAQQIVEAQWQLQRSAPGGMSMGFSPVVDGTVLPEHPLAALRRGASGHVPLMLGTAEHEVTTFGWIAEGADTMDESMLRARLRQEIGPRADDLLAGYRESRPNASNRELWFALITDQMMRIPHLRVADARASAGSAPVYNYLFAYVEPILEGRYGATHGAELPLVFANPRPPDTREQRQLGARMRASWANFARFGDPNNSELPSWPAYSSSERWTMVFDTECRVVPDPASAERRAWERTADDLVGVIS